MNFGGKEGCAARTNYLALYDVGRVIIRKYDRDPVIYRFSGYCRFPVNDYAGSIHNIRSSVWTRRRVKDEK